MTKHLATALDAALFVVATCIVFVPQLRSAAMTFALAGLFAVTSCLWLWRMRASLFLAPKQILHSSRRPHLSVLNGIAPAMACAAIVVLSLN